MNRLDDQSSPGMLGLGTLPYKFVLGAWALNAKRLRHCPSTKGPGSQFNPNFVLALAVLELLSFYRLLSLGMISFKISLDCMRCNTVEYQL